MIALLGLHLQQHGLEDGPGDQQIFALYGAASPLETKIAGVVRRPAIAIKHVGNVLEQSGNIGCKSDSRDNGVCQ